MIECHGKLKVRVSQITQCAKSINCRCFKAKKKCSKHLTIKCYNTAGFDLLWWRTQLDSTVRGKKIVESRGGLSVCTKMSGETFFVIFQMFTLRPLAWLRKNVSLMFVVQLVTNMIFVKIFTLADFGPIMFYPKGILRDTWDKTVSNLEDFGWVVEHMWTAVNVSLLYWSQSIVQIKCLLIRVTNLWLL